MGILVCVTGASGFVASWLVKLLLLRGYTVNATVRSLSDPGKVAHLKAFEGADERLHLFEANLTEEGSFDAAVDGCDGVFHTASPVILRDVKDPQTELIDPALMGTLNVLRSCIKVPSIRRVVFTSSTASVVFKRNAPKYDFIIDETWFSDPVLCEELKQWYSLSKTLAEEAATSFAKENGIDLVVINPGFVLGPLLQPTLNVTAECFLQFLEEGCARYIGHDSVGGISDVTPNGFSVLIDVRDLANAHILAFENPSASGRYCLVASTLSGPQAFDILRRLYPTLKVPKSVVENQQTSLPFHVSNEKAKSLGMDFRPIEQSLKDTVESLTERKLISFDI